MLHIAIFDDDPAFRTALAEGLSSHGFTVDAPAIEEELFEVIAVNDLHCLVLDYHLAESNGIEVYKRMIQRGLVVPVVFLSACASPAVVQAALNAGAESFMSKPTRLDDLVAIIRRIGQPSR